MLKKVFYLFLMYNPVWVILLTVFVWDWLIWLSPIIFVIAKIIMTYDERSNHGTAVLLNYLVLLSAIFYTGLLLEVNFCFIIAVILLVILVIIFWRELVILVYPNPDIMGTFYLADVNLRLVMWKVLKSKRALTAMEDIFQLQSASVYDWPVFYKAYLKKAVSENALIDVNYSIFRIVFPAFKIFIDNKVEPEPTNESYKSRVQFVLETLNILGPLNPVSHFYLDKLAKIVVEWKSDCFNGSEVYDTFLYQLASSELAQSSDSEIIKRLLDDYKKELRKKVKDDNKVADFYLYYKHFSSDVDKELIKKFYKNLDISTLKAEGVVQFSKHKNHVVWNEKLDELFEVTSDILRIEYNDETLKAIADSVNEIIYQLWNLDDKALQNVLEKKLRVLERSNVKGILIHRNKL